MPTNVLIAGGGPAALEAALALHRFAGDRVATTVLAPESHYTYRPLSVLSPFAAGSATTYPLDRIASDAGFAHVRDRLGSVDAAAHTVETVTGETLSYDVLLIASGARPVMPLRGAIAFTGSLTDQERLHGIVQDVEGGYLHSLAFVVPTGGTWPLPLYELALMLAERGYSMGVDLELHVVTPEASPLALFGPDATSEVAGLLAEAGIAVHTGAQAEVLGQGRLRLAPGDEILEVERIVTLPRLAGPSVLRAPVRRRGLSRHGRPRPRPGRPRRLRRRRRHRLPGIKQGGIACQQADAAAADIAARAGAPVEPVPFSPVLRGMLLTERWARFMRREAGDDATVAGRALWWPPTKIAGRELAGYLEGLDEEAGRPAGLPVSVKVGDADTAGIEVLSLH